MYNRIVSVKLVPIKAPKVQPGDYGQIEKIPNRRGVGTAAVSEAISLGCLGRRGGRVWIICFQLAIVMETTLFRSSQHLHNFGHP